MDTHNKRTNYINRATFNHIGLVPDNDVELSDLKNYLWVPFFFNYPAPIEEESTVQYSGISIAIGCAINM